MLHETLIRLEDRFLNRGGLQSLEPSAHLVRRQCVSTRGRRLHARRLRLIVRGLERLERRQGSAVRVVAPATGQRVRAFKRSVDEAGNVMEE